MVLADRCDSCGCGILPGQHVFSVTDDGFQVLCYDCKDIVDDEEEWGE
jgi:phage major head subunit gpT-like protein